MKREGEWLGGYVVVRRLGSGGMSTVYEAINGDGDRVALKVLHPHIGADPVARARLRREVDSLQRIRHRGVAQVLDAESESDEPFVVTELVDGRTLEERVAADGALDRATVAALGHGLREALAAIHAAGVVHRDVKPANVMLTGGGPVLIDFGISQLLGAERYTVTGLVTGTPGYMDPRMSRGALPDVEADWWSFSAVLAFAATGRPPYGRGAFEAVLSRAALGEADLAGLPADLGRAFAAALRPAEPRLAPEDLLAVLDGDQSGAEAVAALEDEVRKRQAREAAGPAPTAVVPPPRPPAAPTTALAPAGSPPPPPGPVPAPPTPTRVLGATSGAALPRPSPPAPPPLPRAEPYRSPAMPAPLRSAPAGQAYRPPPLPYGYGTGHPPPGHAQQGVAPPGAPAGYPQPGFPGYGYPGPWGGYAGPHPDAPARRRPLVFLVLWLVAGTLAALWPGPVLVVVTLLLLVAGAYGSGRRTVRNRRLRHGRRGSDVAVAWATAPLHLIRSAGLVVMAAIAGLVTGGTAWLLAWAAATGQPIGEAAVDGAVENVVTAATVAVALGAAWLVPWSALLREGGRELVAVLVPGRTARVVVVLVGLGVAVGAASMALVGVTDPTWAPLPSPAG